MMKRPPWKSWSGASLAALGICGLEGRAPKIGLLLVSGLLVLWLSLPVLAQKKFLERVRRHYLLNQETGKCTLCHAPKPKEEPGKENLNVFGKDLQADPAIKISLGKDGEYKFNEAELAAVEQAAANIECKDSDGDGATNKEELELGTFPGDPNSKPDPKKLEDYRKAHVKK